MNGEDRLGELRRLEEQFAEAMQHLYAVGNEIARLRHDVEAGTATAPVPSVPPGSSPASPVVAAPAAPAAPPPLVPPVPATAAPPYTPPDTPAAAPPPLVPPVPGPPTAPTQPPTGAAPAAGPTAYPIPVPVPSEPRGAIARWWQRESLVTRLLGITGAVVTLAGLVMLLVLAVQQRWFGPVPRVTLGVLLALALIGLAHVVHGREKAAGRPGHGAVALAGTGYAAAYLDVVAVTTIYAWVAPAVGLVLAFLVAGTGLFLARRWGSQLLAVLILVGAAILAPIVADGASWLLSAFMVVLAVAAWPAQRGRDWPAVTAARLLPATLVIIPTTIAAQHRVEEPWAHVAVTLVLALAGLAMASVDARSPGTDTSALTVALTGLPLLVAISPVPQPWRTVVFLLVAVLWLGHAALGELQRWVPVGTTFASAGLGTLALVLAVLAREDQSWMWTILLVVAAGYLLVAGTTRSLVALAWGGLLAAVALLAYLRHPLTVLFQRSALRADLPETIVESVAAGLVVVALAWLVHRWTGPSVSIRRLVGAVSWVLALVVATTALVAGSILIGRQIDSAAAGFRAGHALATILWMVAAAWLLIRGLQRTADADLAVWLGLGLAAGSVAKLFLYDLAALRGIWRVVAFIVVGLLLLATGAGYARALDRARAARAGDAPPAPPAPTAAPPPPPPTT